jgi:hypothetical protein
MFGLRQIKQKKLLFPLDYNTHFSIERGRISTGNKFQDLPRLRENADNTDNVIFV